MFSRLTIVPQKRAMIHSVSQQVLTVNSNNSDHKDNGDGSSTVSKATIQADPEAIQMMVQNQTTKITQVRIISVSSLVQADIQLQRIKLSPLQVEKPIRLANVESKEAQKAALIDASAPVKEVGLCAFSDECPHADANSTGSSGAIQASNDL